MQSFNLRQYVQTHQAWINETLQLWSPPETEWPESLHQSMLYSIRAGGKRLLPILALAACEAVGRMDRPRETPVLFVSPAGFDAARPAAVIVSAPKLVFSGVLMAFGEQDADLRLAFERLRKATEPLESQRPPFYVSTYALTRSMQEKAGAVAREVFSQGEIHPASTSVVLEGLPSLDATAAMELVTVGK